ncbi:hypothetical protein CONLIGDRAFT_160505 [Coniochaeta ligniaria NRRL 30616]|uniref:Secreted protein n=1 Tax=Coniochaeta ligniaria NRRL 30616 TaxID=1408157 RepID=A0A1J7JYS3_9PEZI|nr:hypothetical protein CONLIGDRAFT_160505 [Coniochaeta ligniaria NRRL 30616]
MAKVVYLLTMLTAMPAETVVHTISTEKFPNARQNNLDGSPGPKTKTKVYLSQRPRSYRLLSRRPMLLPTLLTAVMHMYTAPTARPSVTTSRGGSSTNAATTPTPHHRNRSSCLSRAAAASAFQAGDHPGTEPLPPGRLSSRNPRPGDDGPEPPRRRPSCSLSSSSL